MKKLILIFLLLATSLQAQWFVPNPKGLLRLNNTWTGTQTFEHILPNGNRLYNLGGISQYWLNLYTQNLYVDTVKTDITFARDVKIDSTVTARKVDADTINATGDIKINGNSVRPYKVYTALLTQTDTLAPVATVLENTLGGKVVWARASAGSYTAKLTGAFLASKLFIPNYRIYYPEAGDIISISIDRYDDDTLQIITTINADQQDGLLGYVGILTPIEIRVYYW